MFVDIEMSWDSLIFFPLLADFFECNVPSCFLCHDINLTIMFLYEIYVRSINWTIFRINLRSKFPEHQRSPNCSLVNIAPILHTWLSFHLTETS